MERIVKKGQRVVSASCLIAVMMGFVMACVTAWSSLAMAQAPAPVIERPVVDLASALPASKVPALEQRVIELRERTGVQLALLLVPSTAPEPIEDYAQRVFEQWGGGAAGRDDGALFVLALQDRKSRLHLGYGLEPVLSDAQSLMILNALRPALREADYAQACEQLILAVDAKVQHLTPGSPRLAAPAPLSHRVEFILAVMVLGLVLGAGLTWLAIKAQDDKLKALAPVGLCVAGAACGVVAGQGGLGVTLLYGAFVMLGGLTAVDGANHSEHPLWSALRTALVLAACLGMAYVASEDLELGQEDALMRFGGSAWFIGLMAMAFTSKSKGSGGSSYGSSGGSSGGSSRSSGGSSGGWSGGGGRSGGGGASSSW